MGGTYRQEGDYLISNFTVTTEEQSIGIWGQRHLRYLKQNRKVLYYNLLTSGYLADIDKQAEDMFNRLVKQMAERRALANS